MVESKNENKKPDFYIVNTVRRAHTRTRRALHPTRARFTQHVCGSKYRLLRKQSVAIFKEEALAHREELEEKTASGVIEVRVGHPTGPVLDFATLEGVEEPEPKAELLVGESAEPTEVVIEEESAVETEDEEPESEIEEEGEEQVPDFDSMKKAELIEYLVQHTGAGESDLKTMKKAELLEIVKS